MIVFRLLSDKEITYKFSSFILSLVIQQHLYLHWIIKEKMLHKLNSQLVVLLQHNLLTFKEVL